MSSLIEQIATEAKVIFSKAITDPDFADSFNKFLGNVGKLQAPDVKLNESLLTASSYQRRKASCYYIKVSSSETFIIAIYVLNPGVKAPLHDHPGIKDIVKVIKGSIRISNYTPGAVEEGTVEAPQDVKDKVGKSQRKDAVFMPVYKHKYVRLSEGDPACVLRPMEGEFLEVCALGYMAAFLDVRAPPYDMVERECRFYRSLETTEQEAAIKTWLVMAPPNNEFNSFNLPYCGPEIKL